MRIIFLLALSVCALAQGTNPGTLTWVKTNPGGYPVKTIAQFDKAVWDSCRQTYTIWGQYKTATFSEQNDAMGWYSYAENRWHMGPQAGSQHNTGHPQGGHQWGFHAFIPAQCRHLLFSSSGAQGLETYWVLWQIDSVGNTVRELPLMSSGGVLKRQFWRDGETLSGYMDYDYVHDRLVVFPDFDKASGRASICNLTTMTCQQFTTTPGPPAGMATSNLRFDPDDGYTYWYGGGGITGGGGSTQLWRIDAGAATPTWQAMSNPTCIGADALPGPPCSPPLRSAAGLAYSTVDHVWLLVGGITTGGVAVVDTWKFDPAANGGNGQWTELCGPGTGSGTPIPGMPTCGTPSASYPSFGTAREGDRLVFDETDNVFLLSDDGGAIWAFALSTPLNYGRSSGAYAPPVPSAPIIGSLNRLAPPTSPTTATTQTEAFDLSIDSAGGVVYLSSVQPTEASNTSTYNVPTPYVWSSATGFMPGGATATTASMLTAGAAINSGQGTVIHPSGHPFHLKFAGDDWVAHERRNWSGMSTMGKSVLQRYNAGTGIWNATQYEVPCFMSSTQTCGSNGGDKPRNYPFGLKDANGIMTLGTIETDHNFNPWSWIYLSQWNGSALVSLSGGGSPTTALNFRSNSFVSYAAFDVDTTGNILVCWSEEVNSTRTIMTVTPQLGCKLWDKVAGSFSTFGGSNSLNQSASSWSRSLDVAYSGVPGTWFVASTEETQTGVPKLYVRSCTISSCTLLGGSTLNMNATTGVARHPSIKMDGSDLIVVWDEQAVSGQAARLHIKKWNGSSWATLQSNIAANATNGSVSEPVITIPTPGTMTVAWTEKTWGNLRQIYSASYNTGASCAITTTSLTSGYIGLAISTQIATANCTSPTFTVSAGALPNGLTLNSSGLISGTPTTAQTNLFTIAVSDANGNPSQVLSLTINTPSVYITLSAKELVCSGCPTTGIARTDEATTFGLPLADAANLTSTSSLNLIGASAAQFTSMGTWPSGHLKWVKVSAVVPSVSAGSTAALTLTNAGSGNFGGSNLATDNGTTITVATGSATFTIKKANFNFLDVVDVGATHLVLTGSSATRGIVLLGPDSAATYPGNVTCATDGSDHAGVSSVCNRVYSSANDSSTTASIEENGPAVAVILVTGSLKDASGVAYMRFTQRLSFVKGKTHVKHVTILKNADFGASNTFASASKGFQALDIRLPVNLAGTLTYNIANHSTTTTGTMSGSDTAYLYQAESNQMKNSGWCSGLPGCVLPSPLTGYTIMVNGSQVASGTASQYAPGWADIADSGGAGVEIGQYYLAGYGNKSLEFRSGGTEVRIGLWAGQNNTTSLTTTTPNKPYYQRWPQYNTQEAWMVFHSAAPSSLVNEHLKLQHPLSARATGSTYYHDTHVVPYPILSTTEEDSYYSTLFSSSSPSVTVRTPADHTLIASPDQACSSMVCAWRYWRWPQSGIVNQQEFRRGSILRWWTRAYSGGLINAKNWYRMAGDLAWPHSDGFDWRSRPQSEKQYYDFPTATSANSSLAMSNQIENDGEHANMQGLFLYYFVSGDETYREYADAYADAMLNGAANSLYTSPGPAIWNSRSLGNVFMSLAVVYDYLLTTGDSVNASTILTRAQSVWNSQFVPDLCAYTNYPSGCTPDNFSNIPQTGLSKVRGVQNPWRDTSVSPGAACSGIIPGSVRTQKTFMAGRMLEGMVEWLDTVGTANLSYGQQMWDYAYGTVQWALNEMLVDNGSQTSWVGNGWRYAMAVDYPNACNATGADEFTPKNIHPGLWFYIKHRYDGSTNWKRNFDFLVQWDSANGLPEELFYYVVGNNIYAQLHPTGTTLSTVSSISFTDLGSNNYRLSWTPVPGATSYRIKYGAKQVVDWIGFDPLTYTFTGNPATTQPWFSSTEYTGSISAAGTTIPAGLSGLSASNFMVKAIINGAAPPASTNGGTEVSGTAHSAGKVRK